MSFAILKLFFIINQIYSAKEFLE